MDTLTAVPGLLSLTELVTNIIDRFGTIHPRLKMTKEKDIKEPTSDFVVTLYLEYLRYLNIDVTVSAGKTKKIENPDAYWETLPMMNIYKALRKIFNKQNAIDFSMLDLVSPTFKRTYGGVAVMDNYINFCQCATEELSPKLLAIQEKIECFEEICKKKDKLLAELNKKSRAHSERAGKIAQINLVLSDTKCSISKLNSIASEKISRENDLRSELQTVTMKTNALKVRINELEGELNFQKSLVVSDPGQIEREDLQKRESLIQMTEQVNALKENLDISLKEIQVFEQMMEIKTHLEKYMETTRKLKRVLDEKENQLSNKEKTLETRGIESKSKRDEFMKKKVIISRLKENLSSEKAKADSRLAAMEKTVRQLAMERAKLNEKISVNSTTCKKLLPLIREQEKLAQQWIETKRQCEAMVVEKKNALDEQVKLEVVEIDKILHKVHATAEALNAKAAKELANSQKLLNEQRASDAAEGRTYIPDVHT